jgi:AraC-like DNA-binding protein
MSSAIRMVRPSGNERRFAFTALETSDPQQHSSAVSDCDHQYEQVERSPFRGRISELQLDSMHVLRDQLFTPHVYRGPSWTGSHVFFSFLPSAGSTFLQGRPVNHEMVLKYPTDYFCRSFASGPVDCIAISVRAEAFEAESIELTGQAISPQLARQVLCVRQQEVVARFQKCAVDMLEHVASSPAVLEDPDWRRAARQTVMQMLLDVVKSDTLGGHKLPPPSTRAYVVTKAIEYIKANMASVPVLSDVCRNVRVSQRTLRYSFEEILGVSPSHYLLSLRLRCVRDELLQGRGTIGIHRVAQRNGFGHMGRFALFYQQAFGELPSETCRKATARLRSGARGATRIM